MVEIRVAVPDAAQAHGLLARLAALFGRSSVSFDGTHNEVTRSLGVGVAVGRRGDRHGRVLASGRRRGLRQAVDRRPLGIYYLQMLQANRPAHSNKLWLIPSEYSHALAHFPQRFPSPDTNGKARIPAVAKDFAG